jgi:alpha-2-macroglobulin-like protein
MKIRLLKNVFTILCSFFITKGFTQHNEYSLTKEKLYVHTNHIFFKPGEQLFFKVYVVNAQDQTPAALSKIVYVDIINPAGGVMQKLTYPITDGYAEGSFDFTEETVGGIYRLKAYTSWMQNETDNTFFTKEITVQKTIAPRILMKLDFPQKGYGAGELVTADYSIRNLNDEPIRNYDAKYTVSIAGETVINSTLKTNREGKAIIQFTLPQNLKSNDGLLNVTVDYDSYTEAISRSIPITLNNIDVQFMPEGGTLISDISSNVAFKAINEFGKPVDIKGTLFDKNGNQITAIESYKFGMGKFIFIPKNGETYYVKLTSPINITQQYNLPRVNSNGIVMQVKQADKKVFIKISATETTQIKIVGQTKNKIYYEEKISLAKGEQTIEVNPTIFPVGIAQFTIYTSTNLPVAERLVFLNETKNLQVKITTDKKQYLPREKVKLTLTTTDVDDNGVPANFSISVVDDKLWSFADDKQNHILSWLLLNSELKGNIEEPPFYFKKEETKAIPALDLVMLTHGYRYFDFIEYVQQEQKLKFTPDQTNVLSGIVVNEKNIPIQATLFLTEYNNDGKVLKFTTNKKGEFFVNDLQANKNYFLISQSLEKKEKININVLQNGIGYNPLKNIAFSALNYNDDRMPAIRTVALTKKELSKGAAAFDNRQFLELNNFEKGKTQSEVVVVSAGYGASRRRDMASALTMVRADQLNQVPKFDMALQGKMAGLSVQTFANPGAGMEIMLRGAATLNGNNQPLLVINGIPSGNLGMANQINPNDIESITVLKNGAATAIYGSTAANGVIMIDTKKFRNSKKQFNITKNYFYTTKKFMANGTVFSAVKKFYAPKYENITTETRTDFRETIYWNPTVQTDKNGKAVLEFYNSDASTTFRVITEGIGYNGVLGRTEKTYSVQNAISIDVKIPPYLTVGDKALIPLVIKNNSDNIQYIDIQLQLPEHIIAKKFTNSIVLKEGQSEEILIPIEALQAVKNKIQFIVTNNDHKEKIILPIEATNKGFTVIETFSGNTSQQHMVNISKIIPGTLQSKLKMFNNVEGQLLDGIESMLREPSGCFEQTSSSTYPNVFILKYLKESGKVNEAIESKALDYIEKGYKRLTGFETSQDGFEWFGKTPPHEALTAYGLLEFTDMQEFIKVDQKMLSRTKKFLLSKKDGKGGFTIASGGYDRFASVPNKIANIYIVYALTQAGIGNEIKLEYETAIKKVMETKDGYQLAMMALAAHNMKNENDFKLLLQELYTAYTKNNLASETSVVNSRDASLRVEVLSLYTMALCRETNPKLGLIADLITKIVKEKNYYGYGSTQPTVLALNAVVSYSKLAGKISKETKMEFVLNNKKINEGNIDNNDFTEGSNNFSVQYQDQAKTVPYSLEVAYNTFTPPNSEKAALQISTILNNTTAKIGETVRMQIEVQNKDNILQPMAIAKIGIPAGLTLQPWQLKEIAEKNQVAYYEMFDNYLVFYWMGFAPNETKTINLDLKVDIQGTYKAKASNIYLYYTPEYKNWADGVVIDIKK